MYKIHDLFASFNFFSYLYQDGKSLEHLSDLELSHLPQALQAQIQVRPHSISSF